MLRRRCRDWLARVARLPGVALAFFAAAIVAGCEQPFEPYLANDSAVFSLFGYLDLKADTQWVRVMPVRQNLFLDPTPIDAVVTLQRLGSGRVVTLRDSLFEYVDQMLGSVGYAHNFWTTERLEPEATYRLRATRSDGAWTEANIEMPADFEFTLLNTLHSFPDTAVLEIGAERVLFVEVIYAMRRMTVDIIGNPIFIGPPVPVTVRDTWPVFTGNPGMRGFGINGVPLLRDEMLDMRRLEIRFAVARPDWPYHAGLPDAVVTLPGAMPSNVDQGFGFVGGVATRTIPFHRCQVLETSTDRASPCTTRYNAHSASIAGRVIREPCGTPYELANIRLTERFAGGGAVMRTWKTGWDGGYRFEGIEADAELVLDLGPGTPQVNLPRLTRGQRHTVHDVTVQGRC